MSSREHPDVANAWSITVRLGQPRHFRRGCRWRRNLYRIGEGWQASLSAISNFVDGRWAGCYYAARQFSLSNGAGRGRHLSAQNEDRKAQQSDQHIFRDGEANHSASAAALLAVSEASTTLRGIGMTEPRKITELSEAVFIWRTFKFCQDKNRVWYLSNYKCSENQLGVILAQQHGSGSYIAAAYPLTTVNQWTAKPVMIREGLVNEGIASLDAKTRGWSQACYAANDPIECAVALSIGRSFAASIPALLQHLKEVVQPEQGESKKNKRGRELGKQNQFIFDLIEKGKSEAEAINAAAEKFRPAWVGLKVSPRTIKTLKRLLKKNFKQAERRQNASKSKTKVASKSVKSRKDN